MKKIINRLGIVLLGVGGYFGYQRVAINTVLKLVLAECNPNVSNDPVEQEFKKKVCSITEEENRQFRKNTISLLLDDNKLYSQSLINHVMDKNRQLDMDYFPDEVKKQKDFDKFIELVKGLNDFCVKKFLSNESNDAQIKEYYNNYIDFLKYNISLI